MYINSTYSKNFGKREKGKGGTNSKTMIKIIKSKAYTTKSKAISDDVCALTSLWRFVWTCKIIKSTLSFQTAM